MSVLNARYNSAWAEINVRIGQRQGIIQFYLFMFSAAISTAFLPSHPSLYKVIYFTPLLSLFFILLIQMHEVQIAICRSLLCQIEEFSDAYLPGIVNETTALTADERSNFETSIPKFYHGESNKKILSDHRRRFHDRACICLVIFTTLISIVAIIMRTYNSNACVEQLVQFLKSSLAIEILLFCIGTCLFAIALYIAFNIKNERDKYFQAGMDNKPVKEIYINLFFFRILVLPLEKPR